jgi:hypothetical protein
MQGERPGFDQVLKLPGQEMGGSVDSSLLDEKRP